MPRNFQYKGWFFLCPVYLNLYDDHVETVARVPWLEWWFFINATIAEGMIAILTKTNPQYEPSFPFCITGEVNIQIK
jgi:hypothetical protein